MDFLSDRNDQHSARDSIFNDSVWILSYGGFWNHNGGPTAFELTSLTAVRSWGGGSFPTGLENNKVSAPAFDDYDIM